VASGDDWVPSAKVRSQKFPQFRCRKAPKSQDPGSRLRNTKKEEKNRKKKKGRSSRQKKEIYKNMKVEKMQK